MVARFRVLRHTDKQGDALSELGIRQAQHIGQTMQKLPIVGAAYGGTNRTLELLRYGLEAAGKPNVEIKRDDRLGYEAPIAQYYGSVEKGMEEWGKLAADGGPLASSPLVRDCLSYFPPCRDFQRNFEAAFKDMLREYRTANPDQEEDVLFLIASNQGVGEMVAGHNSAYGLFGLGDAIECTVEIDGDADIDDLVFDEDTTWVAAPDDMPKA